MSKIQTELMEATGLKAVRNEDRQDLIKRIMKAVGGLTDKQWDKLSGEAQDWFNAAADDQNAKKKVLPDFPDLEEAEEEEEEKEDAPANRRRGGKEEAKVEVKPKVGVIAKVTTKRGKTYTGKIVELDDEVIVLKMGNGSEEELDRSRVDSIEVAGGEAADSADEGDDPIQVGVIVLLTTKRGKEVTGKIVEIDDKVVVLDVDGEEEEFDRDRVQSIAPTKHAKAEPSSRRGAAKEEPAADEKPKRASNAEGVSIGTRIKELIAEDFEASETDIAKILKKEGIDFKDNTLKLNYVDCHKFLVILKAKKKIK